MISRVLMKLLFQNARNSVLLLFAFFLGTLYALGQDVQSLPLPTVFKNLEKEYNIQFNYAVQDINTLQIEFSTNHLTIEQALQELRLKTKLRYNRVGTSIITVSNYGASTFCGTLLDTATGNPVTGATIISGQTSTTTDSFGFFTIDIKENEPVKVSSVAYETRVIPLSDFKKENCSSFFVIPTSIALENITLTTYLVEGLDKINDGSIAINFDEFTLLPGLIENDVLQTTQALPGITSTDETVSNINIRGGANDQNLILWDNIKMYQTGHFFGLISAFNPQITQRVTIVKNGTSAQYTDGTSGTLAMFTDDKVTQNTHGNIAINFLSAEGFIDLPTGKHSSLQVAGRHSLSDFLRTPTYDTYFDRISQNTEVENNEASIINADQSFSFYDTSLRWIYNISPKDRLQLNFIVIGNSLDFNESALINNMDRTRASLLTQNSIAGGVDYKRKWSDTSASTIQLYETDYTLRARNANVLENQRFLQENIVSETSIRLSHELGFNERWNLLGGYQFVETGVTNLDDVDDPFFRRKISEVVREHALFAQAGFSSLSQKTNLSLGMRYNYIEKFQKSLIEPRISLRQKLSSALTLQAQAEMKHQNTSQVINFQNDFLGIEKRRWRLADGIEIPVMESAQASLGVAFEKKGWLADVTGYFKAVEGITAQSQGFETKYEFQKAIGNYDVLGVDVLLRKRSGDFTSWLSYGFMDNTYHFDSLPENTFPSNYDITHAVTLGTTYAIDRLKLSAGWNWRSGKPTTFPVIGEPVVSGTINFQDVNSDRLASYMRVDFSANYTLVTQANFKLELGASLWNVTNQENVIANFFRVSNNNTLASFSQESLGTTVNGVIRMSFL
ncbi:TonB-dependent receptor [Dokdonia sinensis]|uniref:TonB-dependent receptor n=2 Tax=Dokdonia sinensis TaxID=2479847 RepID=A0A3M0GP76_9FLAO|nr:TonB-dependent receptor [Dokdonia sinensis]